MRATRSKTSALCVGVQAQRSGQPNGQVEGIDRLASSLASAAVRQPGWQQQALQYRPPASPRSGSCHAEAGPPGTAGPAPAWWSRLQQRRQDGRCMISLVAGGERLAGNCSYPSRATVQKQNKYEPPYTVRITHAQTLPAESPSTKKISHSSRLVDAQSASLPAAGMEDSSSDELCQ